jgi:hypothetical protein
MLAMTNDLATTERLVLLAPPRATRRSGEIRRYRLARLRVAGERRADEPRFEHIKRAYD